MKKICALAGIILCVSSVQGQVTNYVDVSSSTPVAPYISWATAATNIPDATALVTPGDVVLVAAGTYGLGSQVMVSNCTLESVAGPAMTIISNNLQVGVFVHGSNALIKGFSITGLRTNAMGVGIFNGGVMDSCWVYDNTAVGDGTIAVAGIMTEIATIKNSLIYSNQAIEVGAEVTDALVGGVALVGAVLTNSEVFACSATGTLSTNTDVIAGGVYSYIDGAIYDSSIRDNDAYGRAEMTVGGVFFNGAIVVQDTTISDNSGISLYDGTNDALVAGGMVGLSDESDVTAIVKGSSIVSNEAYSGEDLEGILVGGLVISQDEAEFTTTVSSCSISYNSAYPNDSSGIPSIGGLYGANYALSNVLVQGNAASGTLALAIGGIYTFYALGESLRLEDNRSFGLTASIGGSVFEAGVYDNLAVRGNSAEGFGQAVAGIHGGSVTIRNALVADNHATATALAIGGVNLMDSTLESCTIVKNRADKSNPSGETVGGAVLDQGSMRNSIASHNLGGYQDTSGRAADAGDRTNVFETTEGGTVFLNNCFPTIQAITNGANNITADPAFISIATKNYQLQPGSPCQDTGANAYAPTNTMSLDFADAPRIIFNVVDMGAYEQQFTANTGTPGWWLESYGLTNYEADAVADSDGDGTPTWKEYVGDTVPTNAASVLMVRVVREGNSNPPGIEWAGGTGVVQYLERSTNLLDVTAWKTILTNPPPTAVSNNLETQGGVLEFYRIRAER